MAHLVAVVALATILVHLVALTSGGFLLLSGPQLGLVRQFVSHQGVYFVLEETLQKVDTVSLLFRLRLLHQQSLQVTWQSTVHQVEHLRQHLFILLLLGHQERRGGGFLQFLQHVGVVRVADSNSSKLRFDVFTHRLGRSILLLKEGFRPLPLQANNSVSVGERHRMAQTAVFLLLVVDVLHRAFEHDPKSTERFNLAVMCDRLLLHLLRALCFESVERDRWPVHFASTTGGRGLLQFAQPDHVQLAGVR